MEMNFSAEECCDADIISQKDINLSEVVTYLKKRLQEIDEAIAELSVRKNTEVVVLANLMKDRTTVILALSDAKAAKKRNTELSINMDNTAT